MQPYQEAAEEIRRQGELPIKSAKQAASFAGSAAAGSAMVGRIVPWLSKYIPEELAIKGLAKIDSRLGGFIKKAMSEGYDFDEVKNFIGEKMGGAENKKPPSAKENQNIIQQYSPELHQFISEHIQQGRSPLEAGAIAQLDRKGGKSFKSIIKKIEQDHKSPFSAILQTVYGSQEAQAQPQQAQSQQQPEQGVDPQLAQIMSGIKGVMQNLRGAS